MPSLLSLSIPHHSTSCHPSSRFPSYPLPRPHPPPFAPPSHLTTTAFSPPSLLSDLYLHALTLQCLPPTIHHSPAFPLLPHLYLWYPLSFSVSFFPIFLLSPGQEAFKSGPFRFPSRYRLSMRCSFRLLQKGLSTAISRRPARSHTHGEFFFLGLDVLLGFAVRLRPRFFSG